ncbi:hypothetical protein [Actinomycetospora sp. NBRC 106375]|uniref:hypothetical protein n=1 Tax=Actinomycetospora sp. NBRC 106375 TaxID=3032207 RepID=UPI002555E5BC|nr:hypothetical protein [Actinomycetospora sp. NBRC 106375]
MATTKTAGRGSSIPGAGWVRPWLQLAEIAVSAPVVVGYRTTRLVLGGWPPPARERRELVRMVTEKADAFGRAAVAAVTTPPRDAAAAVGAVVAPVHRSVVANRRRLARS